MNHWLANSLQHLPLGEALTLPIQGLLLDWRRSAVGVWKPRTGAERWHAAMHDVDASTTIADSFKSRVAQS